MIIYVGSVDSHLRRLHRRLSYLCTDRFTVDHRSPITNSLVIAPLFPPKIMGSTSNRSNYRPYIRISSLQLIECLNVRLVSPSPLPLRSPRPRLCRRSLRRLRRRRISPPQFPPPKPQRRVPSNGTRLWSLPFSRASSTRFAGESVLTQASRRSP